MHYRAVVTVYDAVNQLFNILRCDRQLCMLSDPKVTGRPAAT